MDKNRLRVSGRGEYNAYFNSSLSLDEMATVLRGILIGHGWRKRVKDAFFGYGPYEYVYGEMDYGARLEIKHIPATSNTDEYLLELKIYCKGEDKDETLRKVSRIIDNLENILI